jgi:flagellar motor protein MotB
MSEAPSSLKPSWTEASEESYYVSISDMLIGLLFLFIIMLMYVALQLRETTDVLKTSEQTRTELLQKISTYLTERNVAAEADFEAGVLRLPDEILFEKGRDDPKAEGVRALRVLADAFEQHLPCYTYRRSSSRPSECVNEAHNVEAIFIEGHTDSDRFTSNGRLRDNWDLSAARASNTFRILDGYKPTLGDFLSDAPSDPEASALFSIAGYADERPVDPGSDELAKSRNRRIDIRIVMASPKAPDAD